MVNGSAVPAPNHPIFGVLPHRSAGQATDTRPCRSPVPNARSKCPVGHGSTRAVRCQQVKRVFDAGCSATYHQRHPANPPSRYFAHKMAPRVSEP
jgi:hypothetical protein